MMKTIFTRVIIGAGLLLLNASLLIQMRQRPSVNTEPATIVLTAIPGLQFDLPRFVVRPGARVKVILKNADDMSHNLVFTKPGARKDVVEEALKLEEKGPSMNYIPVSPDVLWTIPVISPGEEGSMTFTAPQEPGIYPYVCTFPGHGYYMYGAMYVKRDDNLPAIDKDENIPQFRKQGKDAHAGHGKQDADHPYELKPPYLYRAYMEDSGPASIAVRLPNALSYCWDSDVCALRYAWEGEFVDNTALWKGKPNAVARVLGTIFFRGKVEQPLALHNAGSTHATEFKGYRLIERYPEFHYTINGVDVYELIRSKDDGSGLIRTFRIPDASDKIIFSVPTAEGVAYECSVGTFIGNTIEISPDEAKNFRIVMTKTSK